MERGFLYLENGVILGKTGNCFGRYKYDYDFTFNPNYAIENRKTFSIA